MKNSKIWYVKDSFVLREVVPKRRSTWDPNGVDYELTNLEDAYDKAIQIAKRRITEAQQHLINLERDKNLYIDQKERGEIEDDIGC